MKEKGGGASSQVFFKDFVYFLNNLLLLLQVPRTTIVTICEETFQIAAYMEKLKNFRGISRR